MPHTPGPWKAGWGKYIPITAMVNGTSAQIGRAESFGQIPEEEVESNGALFAAAPKLLGLARGYLRYLETHPSDELTTEIVTSAVRAAIAEAEGV